MSSSPLLGLRIAGSHLKNSLFRNYVEYVIELNGFGSQAHIVKRFSHLEKWTYELEKEIPSQDAPLSSKVPPKRLLRNLSPDFLSQRHKDLDALLSHLSNETDIIKTDAFWRFADVDDTIRLAAQFACQEDPQEALTLLRQLTGKPCVPNQHLICRLVPLCRDMDEVTAMCVCDFLSGTPIIDSVDLWNALLTSKHHTCVRKHLLSILTSNPSMYRRGMSQILTPPEDDFDGLLLWTSTSDPDTISYLSTDAQGLALVEALFSIKTACAQYLCGSLLVLLLLIGTFPKDSKKRIEQSLLLIPRSIQLCGLASRLLSSCGMAGCPILDWNLVQYVMQSAPMDLIIKHIDHGSPATETFFCWALGVLLNGFAEQERIETPELQGIADVCEDLSESVLRHHPSFVGGEDPSTHLLSFLQSTYGLAGDIEPLTRTTALPSSLTSILETPSPMHEWIQDSEIVTHLKGRASRPGLVGAMASSALMMLPWTLQAWHESLQGVSLQGEQITFSLTEVVEEGSLSSLSSPEMESYSSSGSKPGKAIEALPMAFLESRTAAVLASTLNVLRECDKLRDGLEGHKGCSKENDAALEAKSVPGAEDTLGRIRKVENGIRGLLDAQGHSCGCNAIYRNVIGSLEGSVLEVEEKGREVSSENERNLRELKKVETLNHHIEGLKDRIATARCRRSICAKQAQDLYTALIEGQDVETSHREVKQELKRFEEEAVVLTDEVRHHNRTLCQGVNNMVLGLKRTECGCRMIIKESQDSKNATYYAEAAKKQAGEALAAEQTAREELRLEVRELIESLKSLESDLSV